MLKYQGTKLNFLVNSHQKNKKVKYSFIENCTFLNSFTEIVEIVTADGRIIVVSTIYVEIFFRIILQGFNSF